MNPMEVGHRLQFDCQRCQCPITFSVLDVNTIALGLTCPTCHQKYSFQDPTLMRQLKLFVALCEQIHASQEILGSTSIAIDVDNRHVKVPFNLLLTRLSSVLDLTINGKKAEIIFRIEPVKDFADAKVKS